MRIWIFILLIIPFLGFSQSITTYKSLASEYFQEDIDNYPTFEWIQRDIVISSKLIRIITYGEGITDIQNWIIQNEIKNFHSLTSSRTYFTHLASGEDMEYPAIFTIIENFKGKVELITFEIPLVARPRLLRDDPVIVRFLID